MLRKKKTYRRVNLGADLLAQLLAFLLGVGVRRVRWDLAADLGCCFVRIAWFMFKSE